MRTFGFILSLLFHVSVVAGALFWANSQPKRVNLDRPVYTVDIVSLAPPAAGKKPVRVTAPPEPRAAPEPAPTKAPEPVQEIKSEPSPEPKPAPKKVVSEDKKISDTKKKKKIIKKKVEKKPEPKPAPKPKPKPKKTAEQLRKEGLAEARKAAQREEKKKDAARKRVLAALKAEVGEGVYAPDAESDEGVQGGVPGGQGTSSGYTTVYGSIVGLAIKNNWRYPALAGDRNLIVTVEIEIGSDGRILNSKILEGSNNAKFDSSVLRAIKETEYVVPPETTRDRVLKINFNSQELPE